MNNLIYDKPQRLTVEETKNIDLKEVRYHSSATLNWAFSHQKMFVDFEASFMILLSEIAEMRLEELNNPTLSRNGWGVSGDELDLFIEKNSRNRDLHKFIANRWGRIVNLPFDSEFFTGVFTIIFKEALGMGNRELVWLFLACPKFTPRNINNFPEHIVDDFSEYIVNYALHLSSPKLNEACAQKETVEVIHALIDKGMKIDLSSILWDSIAKGCQMLCFYTMNLILDLGTVIDKREITAWRSYDDYLEEKSTIPRNTTFHLEDLMKSNDIFREKYDFSVFASYMWVRLIENRQRSQPRI